MPKRIFSKEDVHKAIQMHKQGLMWQTIAAKMGYDNCQSLSSVCRRAEKKEAANVNKH